MRFAVIELHVIVPMKAALDYHKTVKKFHDKLVEEKDVLYFAHDCQRELTELEYNDAQTVIDPKGTKIENPDGTRLAGFKDRELLDELRRRGYMKK